MTIKASLVSLQGCTVNSIDRKQRHKHTDRHRAIDSSALMLSSHFQTWPAQAFPPIWIMILQDPCVCHPVSPSRLYTLPQFPPHSTTLSSNLLLQPWQLKHMFSSSPELGERERKEEEMRGGENAEE